MTVMKVNLLRAMHLKIGIAFALLLVSLLSVSAQGNSDSINFAQPVASPELHVSAFASTVSGILLPEAAIPADAVSSLFDLSQSAAMDRQETTITPVPEPDVVWLASIGLALVALRFRFGEDQQK